MLRVSSATGSPGQQVTIALSLDTGGVLLRSAQVNLTYDGSTLVSPVGAQGTALPADWLFDFNSPSDGELRLVALDLSGNEAPLAGEIFRATFTISPGTAPGSVPISIALAELHEQSLAAFPVDTSQPGSVTVGL